MYLQLPFIAGGHPSICNLRTHHAVEAKDPPNMVWIITTNIYNAVTHLHTLRINPAQFGILHSLCLHYELNSNISEKFHTILKTENLPTVCIFMLWTIHYIYKLIFLIILLKFGSFSYHSLAISTDLSWHAVFISHSIKHANMKIIKISQYRRDVFTLSFPVHTILMLTYSRIQKL
jgi:hypothetical protein